MNNEKLCSALNCVSRAMQHGAFDGARVIHNIEQVYEKLENPVNMAGEPIVLDTKEDYKIYNCLKNMPHCIKSMKATRGDKGSVKGNNRPLENTICVTVQHIDDKTYGGLCVLREWGATQMVNIFVGYNPLQTMIWREMIDDIEDELFTACILETKSVENGAPAWAEGIYKIAEKFNKFPENRPLPSECFNKIFDGSDTIKNPEGKPLTFLYAQRSLCAYNFLRALAQGIKEKKKVFVWEDGGYLNPIIDQAIEERLTIDEFRKIHMIPEDSETDELLKENFVDAIVENFIGSVELTRNGYDLSAAIAETRPMNTRLFSIAASYEKIMLEGDSIVLSCLDALSQVLYSTGYGLRDRTILVLGARGNLGRLSVKHLQGILESTEKQLWGCDLKCDWSSPEPGSIPEWAEWSACDVPLEHVAGEVTRYDEISEKVRYDFDVILGWTGGPKTVTVDGISIKHETIRGKDIADWLTKGTKKANLYLVSGSTKTVEFSDVLAWLESLLAKEPDKRQVNGILLDDFIVKPIPDQLSIAAVAQVWKDGNPPKEIVRNFGTQFTFVFKQGNVSVTKTVYLVNNTMPINFMFYGTPTEIMDMTYSQVTSCAVALVKHKDVEYGIYPTDYKKIATDNVYLGRELVKDYENPKSLHLGLKYDYIFKGAETAYMSSCSYIKSVMETIGVEETLNLMQQTDEKRGIQVGKAMKAELGNRDLDMDELLEVIVKMAKDIGGMDTIIEKTPEKAVTVTGMGKCPIYEAAKSIGMSDSEIEKMCRASSAVFLDKVVEQLNPKFTYQVKKFRSLEDGGCVEEIVVREK